MRYEVNAVMLYPPTLPKPRTREVSPLSLLRRQIRCVSAVPHVSGRGEAHGAATPQLHVAATAPQSATVIMQQDHVNGRRTALPQIHVTAMAPPTATIQRINQKENSNGHVTPKGALQPAKCNASATREGP